VVAAAADNAALPATQRDPPVKPYDIEVLRLKSMKHDKGMVEINVDALVSRHELPAPARGTRAHPAHPAEAADRRARQAATAQPPLGAMLSAGA